MRYLLLALALFAAVPVCAQDKAPAVTGQADEAIAALEAAREALRKLDASYAAQIEALTAERKKIAVALGGLAPKPDPQPDPLNERAAKVKSLLEQVPAAKRQDWASKIAAAYRDSAAIAGAFNNPQLVIDDTSKRLAPVYQAMRQAGVLDAWRPALTALQAYIGTQPLPDGPAVGKLWEDVARGLS